jgi:hypothetical protein
MANESYWSASGMLYIIIERIFILVIFSISGAHILGDNVRLAWNSDPIPNLAGYRLYYGTAPNVHTQKIEVGNFTTVSVPNLIQGQTYFFAVTAYNTAAVESAPSNQVSYTVPSASSGGTLTLPFLLIPSDQTVLRGSTALNDNDSHFVYSGGWALNHWPSYDYLGDEHYSAAAGSTAVLSFTGTQVQLYSTLAHDLGYVEIILDNVPIGFVDAYAPVRTPSKIIYTSPVLPAGPHSITVRVTGQKNALSSHSYAVVDRANVVVTSTPMPSSAAMVSTSVTAPSNQVSDTVAFPQPAAAVAQASASTATPAATATAATTTKAIAASAVPGSTPKPTRLLTPVNGTGVPSQLPRGGSVEAAAYAQWSRQP